MRQALTERRRLANPFASAGPHVEAVAAASIAAASTHFNPRNGPASCGLWRLCRRLGCDGDVLPLLRAAGVKSVGALRCVGYELQVWARYPGISEARDVLVDISQV